METATVMCSAPHKSYPWFGWKMLVSTCLLSLRCRGWLILEVWQPSTSRATSADGHYAGSKVQKPAIASQLPWLSIRTTSAAQAKHVLLCSPMKMVRSGALGHQGED